MPPEQPRAIPIDKIQNLLGAKDIQLILKDDMIERLNDALKTATEKLEKLVNESKS